MKQIPLIVILGPTASGKTNLAVQLANRLDGEIISADSRQIYRGLDIGTGKDLHEFVLGDRAIDYHLIDIMDVGETYSVAHFKSDAIKAINKVVEKGKMPILCGGTGLYIDALLSDYEFSHIPDFLEQNQYLNREFHVFGLNPPLEIRREKCSTRLKQRIDEGLIEEVESLLEKGVSAEDLKWLGLEYKWIVNYLEGTLTFDGFQKGLEISIQQFAKRQMTFFRKMERSGIDIQWVPFELSLQERLDWLISKINF
ncbi:tRNA (adenosine(37)-N6)-dimethylallyltransferase [Aquirufa sp. ROCK-SH2]